MTSDLDRGDRREAVPPPAEEEIMAEEDDREVVWPGELDKPPGYMGIQGSRIEELDEEQLRALAEVRGIVLEVTRDAILQALRDGPPPSSQHADRSRTSPRPWLWGLTLYSQACNYAPKPKNG